jgi:hypothetical protein
MFDQALAVLDDEQASVAERLAAEAALEAFMRVLKDDERCITDLLAYVARAIRRRRPHCRCVLLAAAALRAISDRDRSFETACRVLAWASAVDDGSTVAYLLVYHFASRLRRCDVEPELIQLGYEAETSMRVSYVRSLVRCRVKDDEWWRDFVARELPALESDPHCFSSDIEALRAFATSQP